MIEQSQIINPQEHETQVEPHGSVLYRGDFLSDFASEASRVKAGGEVSAMAMVFLQDEVGDAVHEVFKSIPPEISNQVTKKLYFDDYSRLITGDLRILELDKFIPWRHTEAIETQTNFDAYIKGLKNEGINVNVLNPTSTLTKKLMPFTGRTHLKGSYIKNGDKSVFYIQSGNFEDGLSDDVFIKLTGDMANQFIEVFNQINSENPPQEDGVFEISDSMNLYYDSGKKGESLIRDTAKKLIRNAKKSIKNVSIFHPDAVAKELSDAASQGINTEVLTTKYYSDGLNMSIGNLFYTLNKKSQLNAWLHRDKYNVTPDPFNWAHAKLLIIDDEIAFIGSHNLSSDGIRAGTKEWQILIKDKTIVDGLVRKFRDMKNVATVDPYIL